MVHGLVNEGGECEDVVGGAVVTAEASLGGRPHAVPLGPLGEARVEYHGIKFGEDRAHRQATVVVGV